MLTQLDLVPRHDRRTFLGGALAMMAVLTACGTEDSADAEQGGTGYPRTVTDSTGVDVVIPARPERVVAAQNVWDLDALLALGVAPVQFGLRDFSEFTGGPTTSWPWHERALTGLGAAGAAAERLPVGELVDIEAIAGGRPDLIIGDDFVAEARDQLGELAPVLQIASFDWRANLRLVGAVLDRSDQAETLISDTDAALDAGLADYDLDTPTVGVFAVYDATAFYAFGDPSIPVVDLLQRAGFGFLDELVADAGPDEPRIEFSIEELSRAAGADVLIVFDYSDGSATAGLSALSLYSQLPAVRAGRVIVVAQGERAQGLSVFGPLNVELGLDLVREAADLLG